MQAITNLQNNSSLNQGVKPKVAKQAQINKIPKRVSTPKMPEVPEISKVIDKPKISKSKSLVGLDQSDKLNKAFKKATRKNNYLKINLN